jgi:hypothetical protein
VGLRIAAEKCFTQTRIPSLFFDPEGRNVTTKQKHKNSKAGAPMSKEKLSWEQHQALGLELKQIRNRLLEISMQLPSVYGVTSKVAHYSDQAYQAVDTLRDELDSLIGRDCPEKSPNELNRAYYPDQVQTAGTSD